MKFQKATKAQAKLRLALIGPAGSGKTYTSLALATRLGQRVAVIDTERGSASKYADVFTFDTLSLDVFSPQIYVEAIHAAENAGYDVIVIDSLSHAWVGKGGALEMHDNVQARQKSSNSFTAWREVTPHHNAMVDALIQCRAHLIVTMRAKTEYVQEKDERGKTTVRKVGLAPVQRDGLEYEFDVVGDLDQENTLIVGKTRCSALRGQVIRQPGADLAQTLLAWLGSDTAPAPSAAPTEGDQAITPEALVKLRELAQAKGVGLRHYAAPYLSPHDNLESLTIAQGRAVWQSLAALPDRQSTTAAAPPPSAILNKYRGSAPPPAELRAWVKALDEVLSGEGRFPANALYDHVTERLADEGYRSFEALSPAAAEVTATIARDFAAAHPAKPKGGVA